MFRYKGMRNRHFLILDDEDGVTEEIARVDLLRIMAAGIKIDGLEYADLRIVVRYISSGEPLVKRLLMQGIDIRVNDGELLWLSLRENFNKERRIVLSEFCNRVADKVLPFGGEAWRNEGKVILVFDDNVHLKGSNFNLNAMYNIGFMNWLHFDLTSLTDADVVYTYLMRVMGLANDVSKRIIDNPERLKVYQLINRVLYGGKFDDFPCPYKNLGVVMWNTSKLFRRTIKQLLKVLESKKGVYSGWDLEVYTNFNFNLIRSLHKVRPLAEYFQNFVVHPEADKLFRRTVSSLIMNN